MDIAENKYHSTIKVEFKDLVDNMVNSSRKKFHMYTIHRLLSLGLLIDFPFKYLDPSEVGCIGIELDLKESGKAAFLIDPKSEYGRMANKQTEEVLTHFLQHFDTGCDTLKKRRSWF